MLRFQIALAIIFLGCIAFLSCGRTQDKLDPVTDDTMDMTMDMTMDAMMEMMETMASVTLPAPTMTVAEAKAAMNPGGTGAAHVGQTTRTVYFNEAGAIANKAGTAYPAGTMIIKKVMDPTETFVQQVVTMTKTDDPMYAPHNYWIYGVAQRESETDELMPPHQLTVEMSMGCHGCHAEASNDSVFVSLTKDQMMDDGMTDDGNGNGANGNGNGNGANGNGATQ